jgi:hypothetical protein
LQIGEELEKLKGMFRNLENTYAGIPCESRMFTAEPLKLPAFPQITS